MRLTAAQIATAAQAGGFLLNSERATAVAIALAESGGETTATNKNTNGTTDFGLWQINSIHAAILRGRSWSDPTDNARMAHQVYADAGNSFHPWVTYNSGRYLAFLSVARAAVYGGKTGGALPPSGGNTGSAKPNATGTLSVLPPNPLTGLIDLTKILTNGSLWLRAGMLFAGALLLWWGIRSLTELDNEAAAAVVKTGMAVATDGASVAATKVVGK